MSDWIKVAETPLGLAGFALFILFNLLAFKRRRKSPRWLVGGVFIMACVTLIGGLFLGYSEIHKTPGPAPVVNQQNFGQINQRSSGGASVNSAGVQGSVTVNKGEAAHPSGKTGE